MVELLCEIVGAALVAGVVTGAIVAAADGAVLAAADAAGVVAVFGVAGVAMVVGAAGVVAVVGAGLSVTLDAPFVLGTTATLALGEALASGAASFEFFLVRGGFCAVASGAAFGAGAVVSGCSAFVEVAGVLLFASFFGFVVAGAVAAGAGFGAGSFTAGASCFGALCGAGFVAGSFTAGASDFGALGGAGFVVAGASFFVCFLPGGCDCSGLGS